MRNLGKRARLDAALAKAKVTARVMTLDVTSEASRREALAAVDKDSGPIDVLVNNAGYGVGGFVHDLTLEEIRDQLETNFFGPVALCKAVIPVMIARRSGRIINVSSIGGRMALPVVGAYCASKFALEGFSESLRQELLPFGVFVTLVEPGTFRTDIFEQNRRDARNGRDPASPYFRMTERMEKLVMDRLAKATQDPQLVADAIAKAALVARPKLRYVVGRDAKGQAVLKDLMPFSVVEKLVASQVKLSDYLPRTP